MSRRRSGTNRASAIMGLSVYGPMNTGKRKRPKGAATPIEGISKRINNRITENGWKINV